MKKVENLIKGIGLGSIILSGAKGAEAEKNINDPTLDEINRLPVLVREAVKISPTIESNLRFETLQQIAFPIAEFTPIELSQTEWTTITENAGTSSSATEFAWNNIQISQNEDGELTIPLLAHLGSASEITLGIKYQLQRLQTALNNGQQTIDEFNQPDNQLYMALVLSPMENGRHGAQVVFRQGIRPDNSNQLTMETAYFTFDVSDPNNPVAPRLVLQPGEQGFVGQAGAAITDVMREKAGIELQPELYVMLAVIDQPDGTFQIRGAATTNGTQIRFVDPSISDVELANYVNNSEVYTIVRTPEPIYAARPTEAPLDRSAEYDALFRDWDDGGGEFMDGHSIIFGVSGSADMSVFGEGNIHFVQSRLRGLGVLHRLPNDIRVELIITDSSTDPTNTVENAIHAEEAKPNNQRGYIIDSAYGMELDQQRAGYMERSTRVIRIWVDPHSVRGPNPLVALNGICGAAIDSAVNGGNPWDIAHESRWDLRDPNNGTSKAFVLFYS